MEWIACKIIKINENGIRSNKSNLDRYKYAPNSNEFKSLLQTAQKELLAPKLNALARVAKDPMKAFLGPESILSSLPEDALSVVFSHLMTPAADPNVAKATLQERSLFNNTFKQALRRLGELQLKLVLEKDHQGKPVLRLSKIDGNLTVDEATLAQVLITKLGGQGWKLRYHYDKDGNVTEKCSLKLPEERVEAEEGKAWVSAVTMKGESKSAARGK